MLTVYLISLPLPPRSMIQPWSSIYHADVLHFIISICKRSFNHSNSVEGVTISPEPLPLLLRRPSGPESTKNASKKPIGPLEALSQLILQIIESLGEVTPLRRDTARI